MSLSVMERSYKVAERSEMVGFARERNEAFFSLDKERILAFTRKYETEMLENDDDEDCDEEEVFWCGVHIMICHITGAPLELRLQSERWLAERGYTTYIKPKCRETRPSFQETGKVKHMFDVN